MGSVFIVKKIPQGFQKMIHNVSSTQQVQCQSVTMQGDVGFSSAMRESNPFIMELHMKQENG
jgi:hypothetical protein